MRSAMASASWGPSPQFTPIASAPQLRSVAATSSGVDPSATVSLGSNVMVATMGVSGTAWRAASNAIRISSR
jgi:hypothetical protein